MSALRAIVDLEIAADHGGKAKACLGEGTSRAAVLRALARVVSIALDRRRHGRRVVGWHEESRASLVDQLGVSPDPCGYDGQSGSHRLENGVGDALGERGQHEDVEALHEEGHVVSLAGETGEMLSS